METLLMEIALKLKAAIDHGKRKTICFSRVHVPVCRSRANQYCKITRTFCLFLRLQTKELVLKVNIIKITGENTFNKDQFKIEGSHGSSKEKKTLFWLFLQFCDQRFIP